MAVVERTPVDPPPGRATRPVVDVPTINGRRVIVCTWDAVTGPSYTPDLRATSEVFTQDGDTTDYVNVAAEADWYAWLAQPEGERPGHCPRSRCYPAYLVFAET